MALMESKKLSECKTEILEVLEAMGQDIKECLGKRARDTDLLVSFM